MDSDVVHRTSKSIRKTKPSQLLKTLEDIDPVNDELTAMSVSFSPKDVWKELNKNVVGNCYDTAATVTSLELPIL